MTNLVECLRDLQRHSDACLEDFEAVSEEMQKIYARKNRNINAAMKCMTELSHGANEPVRFYANQIKANWRSAG
jgi:hypothetical protein